MTKDSHQLLAEFVENRSEEAFRELLARYLNLVYSTALRIVSGNAALAEDIAQAVFASLARKAPSLSSEVMLGGWLHQHTCHLARRTMRGEMRRQSREREAVESTMLMDDSHAPWRQLAPILDEAITQLGAQDRSAIMLRYFEQQDFRSIGEALGNSQDAARVRVNRALEKLRRLLSRQGVTLSTTALAALLTTELVPAAPAGLALSLSSAALGSAAASAGGATVLTLFKFMATTKLKLSAAALLLTGAVTTALLEHRSITQLEVQNASLQQQLTETAAENEELARRAARPAEPPALGNASAPSFAPGVRSKPSDDLPAINLYALMTNKVALVKLTPAQAESYLTENARSAASLLSAYRTSYNPGLLQEALQRFPADPQVNFEVALAKDSTPAQRRESLDALKKASPENALAYYLSAEDHFKAGRVNEAVQDILAASSKAEFQDYSIERKQADEEAYRAAGYPVAQANLFASKQLTLPQLVQTRDLGANLSDLANSYQQTGDTASAQATLGMAAALGRRYSEAAPGETMLARMVGITVESNALRAMDPATLYAGTQQTVQERTRELAAQRAALTELAKQADPVWPSLTDQDWISYQTRSTSLGEEAAMRWLVGKFASK